MISTLDAAAIDTVSGGDGVFLFLVAPEAVFRAMDQALEDFKAAQLNAEIAAALSGN